MMDINPANVDLLYFVGQKVVGVNLDPDMQFIIELDKFSIRIECPWRIREHSIGVLTGATDYFGEDSSRRRNETVFTLLQGKAITNMNIFAPVGDLVFEFDHRIYLDIIHSSNRLEGWELIGDGDIHFWTNPGGELNYPLSNPLVKKTE